MNCLPLIGLSWMLSSLSMSAAVLTNGLPMTAAIGAMKEVGYTEAGLDMMARPGSGMDLRFWSVGEGVLIVTYSKASQKISGITFWFADDRPKATRQTFEFDVAAFDTGTGLMTIRTRKGEQDPLDPTALSLLVFHVRTAPGSLVSSELAPGRRAVAQWGR